MTGWHHYNDTAQKPYRDQMYEPHKKDPYEITKKHPEPAQCPDCGLVYQHGRWQLASVGVSTVLYSTRCPACARIHDKIPAGILNISGSFFISHKDEILSLIINKEHSEKLGHPLERIMSVDENNNGVNIAYTGIHLTRDTGETLRQTYRGHLDIKYNDREAPIKVYWHRS